MATEGFESAPVADFLPGQTSRRSHAVYVCLQRDIVLGALRPGQAILELDLAQRFGCAQGTIREALLRLAEEGLVIRQPHRGTHVAPCSVDDAHALIAIRQEVECGYLPRVVARADRALTGALHDDLNAMRNAARDGDEYRLSVHDRAFHTRLFAAADLPLVSPVLARCLVHNHRFKILNSAPNRALAETAERHVPILDGLRHGDLTALTRVLRHHITTIVDFGPDLTDPEPPA